jgi:hypothetical protein
MYPVDDPQALRNPRPDTTYITAGYTGLQIEPGDGPLGSGEASGGSRIIQWGWDPVGLNNPLDLPIPNNLEAQGSVGSITVAVT